MPIPSVPAVGEKVQHYQIIEKIGEGGMGVVYKALDTRLDRVVAIKVLRSSADPSHRMQFAWEARAAAGLRHPNIVVIHDILSDTGADSIVMEHVPGRPLSQVLTDGPISIAESIRYGTELASALEAAHAAGIVHRDLKPSNILLTPEGSVKLLDFGLARLQRQAAEGRTAIPAIAGTYGYLSPEHAQGQPATAIGDIFSFGAVLYEMVTGRPAFPGDSPAAVLASLLRDDPQPVASLSPLCPPELAKIIERCLRKNPRRRFQHMGDVRISLEEITPLPGRRWRQAVRPRVLLFAAIVLILLASEWLIFNRTLEPEANSGPMPLTSFPGREGGAVWSPDGRQVAFAWNGEKQDNFDIYILQPGSTQTFRVTNDPGNDDYPAWSPDGRWIAYRHLLADRSAYTLELISPLGGSPKTILRSTSIIGRPSWTPDSRALVIEMPPDRNQPRAVWAVSVDTGARRQLTWPPAGIDGDHHPVVSPDGGTLVFTRETAWRTAELHSLDLRRDLSPAGKPRKVTDLGFVSWPSWSPDGNWILFMTDHDGGGMWRMDRRGRQVRPVSGVPPTAEGPAMAKRPGGYTSLVFANNNYELAIWRYPGELNPAGTAEELAPSTRSQNYPRYSNDGTRLAFSSTRSGYQEIWVANADGSQPVQLTNLKHRLTEMGQWSPDDKTIAFVSQDRDLRQIYMTPSAGGPAVPATGEAGVEYGTGWSADGRRYYYNSARTVRREVWRVAASGGGSEQMTANGGDTGFESPQGVFYYWLPRPGNGEVLMRRESAGDREVALDPPGSHGRVTTPAAGGFYYQSGNAGIYLFSESTGRATPVVKDPGKLYPQFTITPDGKWFAAGFWRKGTLDLMIMEHFR